VTSLDEVDETEAEDVNAGACRRAAEPLRRSSSSVRTRLERVCAGLDRRHLGLRVAGIQIARFGKRVHVAILLPTVDERGEVWAEALGGLLRGGERRGIPGWARICGSDTSSTWGGCGSCARGGNPQRAAATPAKVSDIPDVECSPRVDAALGSLGSAAASVRTTAGRMP
jgi:hypothetical protein